MVCPSCHDKLRDNAATQPVPREVPPPPPPVPGCGYCTQRQNNAGNGNSGSTGSSNTNSQAGPQSTPGDPNQHGQGTGHEQGNQQNQQNQQNRQSQQGQNQEPRAQYENPGHHDTNSPNYIHGKTPLPSDAEEVYQNAVKDTNRASGTSETYYGQNSDGTYYRYQGQNGRVHWNGTVDRSKVPKAVKQALKAQQEQR